MTRVALPSEADWPPFLQRYDRPLPRYTSYPPVPTWHDDPITARERIEEAAATADGIALYIHIPFCPSLCWYCACNRFITKDAALVDGYLDAVEQELDALVDRVGPARVNWLHWGGGTPNSLSSEQIRRLFYAAASRLTLAPDAELSIEIDPRLATRPQIAQCAALGFNRICLGVQDVQEATGRAVNRLQSYEQTKAAVEWAREFGIPGVGIDLIYGLPLQTRASFARTIEDVLRLRPERIAVYSYAHVPWVNHAQRTYEHLLPSRVEKFGMMIDAMGTLTAVGYVQVGIDHFAAPHDALAVAEPGKVTRTFMGYSPRRADVLVGVGASAISASCDAFTQNQHDIKHYLEVAAGGTITQRGCLLTPDDRARRVIIEGLMTWGRIRAADALPLLLDPKTFHEAVHDGIVQHTAEEICLTREGRLFARTIASCFDAYHRGTSVRHAGGI
jgi:oxygen-independent coproporphyrinogen-3 oxidase